jgi:hypothetical protein
MRLGHFAVVLAVGLRVLFACAVFCCQVCGTILKKEQIFCCKKKMEMETVTTFEKRTIFSSAVCESLPAI